MRPDGVSTDVRVRSNCVLSMTFPPAPTLFRRRKGRWRNVDVNVGSRCHRPPSLRRTFRIVAMDVVGAIRRRRRIHAAGEIEQLDVAKFDRLALGLESDVAGLEDG